MSAIGPKRTLVLNSDGAWPRRCAGAHVAGFTIGMDKHDRAAAFAAFEAALAVSPSLALTYILGSLILAFSGEADRAIEWANRGLRLSPFDPWRSTAFVSSSLGYFQRGQ